LTPAVYVVKKEALYQFKHWSEARCMIYEIPRQNAVDIDTEFDFKLVEFLMQNTNKNE
jgi:CMP-N-acetylneuraminic acid synthetase